MQMYHWGYMYPRLGTSVIEYNQKAKSSYDNTSWSHLKFYQS